MQRVLIGLTAASAMAACVASAAPVPDPLTRRAVPADGKLTLTDYGIRGWGPELIHFTLDTKRFTPGQVTVIGPDGTAVPAQTDGETLAFVASLPKGQSVTYAVQAQAAGGAPVAAVSTLHVKLDGATLEAGNEFLAFRMPAPGERALDPAVEMSQVPAPLSQWRQAGQDWVGAARFVSKRRVGSSVFRVVRQGPACFEYEARYAFVPRGEYVWRLRLSPGVPVAVVTEEYDLGEVTQGEDMLVLSLHKGWPAPLLGRLAGGVQASPMADYVKQRKGAQDSVPVGGVGQAPSPVAPEAGLVALPAIVPGGKWGGLLGGLQVYDAEPPESGRNLAVATLHVGSWRRATAINAWYKEGEGVLLSLPVGTRHIRWSMDIADDFSPFSSHEHDPGLSPTYGRREWGFYAGADAANIQGRFGHIGLDRYKDWLVELPAPTPGHASPRPFSPSAEVAATAAVLDQHPDAALLKTWYLYSGNREDALRQAQTVLTGLQQTFEIGDHAGHNFMCSGLTGYRQAQQLGFAIRAEDALACPDLPADTRRELRRWLAVYANLGSEPDFNPRGAGVHLGNNNMTYNRTLMLTYFAALLPDHPRQAYWLDCLRRFAEYKYATEFAWDGADLECPAYQLYAPLRQMLVTQTALRNLGVADLAKPGAARANLTYLANLSMPEARAEGRRIIPGMGNSANLLESVWGIAMAAESGDPEFAGWLRAMHGLARGRITENQPQAGGGEWNGFPLFYRPAIPARPVALQTAFIPTYGVAFRAHFGSPLETAMLLRAGANWGHWDTDALNVVLYGKGAPLSPGTGYQYLANPAPTRDNGIYHNRVKVGRRDLPEVFGRVDGSIADYGFGPAADYAVADRYYPPELFTDGQGEMHWRRHVLYLKSARPEGANGFVMRDTFPGGEQRRKWWSWLNLDDADRIAVDGQGFAALERNKVFAENEMPMKRGSTVEMKTAFGASTWFGFSRPCEVRIRMTFDYGVQGSVPSGKETKTIVEIPAAAGEDFFYVVFPRGGEEPVPACVPFGADGMKITTAEGTDYVFLADRPTAVERDEVVFAGKAGAVRVSADRVVFCLNAGSGRIGYRGCIVEGDGPFEKTVALAELKPGVIRVEGGYAKTTRTVDLGRGVTVTGEGPFEATLDGDSVRLTTDGRARVIHVSQPPFIVRPAFFVDGRQSMACWTDYPASGWGSCANTWRITLPVPEGKHELTVRNLEFVPGWTRPFAPTIADAVHAP
ncbi:MAG: hypothetical protein BWZ02_02235 [Lentisphaerae bacterium ADurb.BinA184]|nr:MAG: hypothetical protein BWZ02_02235 [Lentisphaerae bacterium ADurb.BinA184]